MSLFNSYTFFPALLIGTNSAASPEPGFTLAPVTIIPAAQAAVSQEASTKLATKSICSLQASAKTSNASLPPPSSQCRPQPPSRP